MIRVLAIGTAVIGISLLGSNLFFSDDGLLIIGIRCLLSALCFVLFLLPTIRKRTNLLITLLASIGSLQWVVVESIRGVDFRRPPMTLDSAFFEYAGWLISEGKILYIDIWDIKPPLGFAITAPLAWIAQGDMLLLHILSVVVSVGFAIGTLLMASAIVAQFNKSPSAKLVAPLCLMAIPGYMIFASAGFRPRFPFLFFGLLALWLTHRKKSFWAGVSAAVSIAFYLPGLLFLCLTLWLNRKKFVSVLFGMMITAVITLTPITLSGTLIPMFNEVLIVPLVVSEETSMWMRLRVLISLSKYALILLPISIIAAVAVARKIVWLPVAMLGAIALLLIDLDSYPDLFLFTLICGIAIALWEPKIDWFNRSKETIVLILAVISLVWMGGFGVIHEPVSRRYYIDTTNEQNMRTVYWNKVDQESCHYRLSPVEVDWMALYRASFPDTAESCLIPHSLDDTAEMFNRLVLP